MAQPAVPVNEDRTDLLGIPLFWAKPSINPPFLWESWIGQFLLAVGLKDNINPQDLLAEPAEVIDEPPPRAEAVGATEDAAEANARVLRYQSAVRRVNELNIDRRRRGLRTGLNWLVLPRSRGPTEVTIVFRFGKRRETTFRRLLSAYGHQCYTFS